MPASQRAEIVLDHVSRTGFVTVSDLAQKIGVSEMTIRRDFDRLESEGLIRRMHGGAVVRPEMNVELNYLARLSQRSVEKTVIGRLAAELVHPGQTLFIDAGSTLLELAKHLKNIVGLTIVTNSLPAQAELLKSNNEVLLVGGKILPLTMSLVGLIAEENVSKLHFDWAFLGTAGIDVKHGLTHSAFEEIPIKKLASKAAAKVAVLADHTKFGHKALSFFMSFEEIDAVVTDQIDSKDAAFLKDSHPSIEVLYSQKD